MTDEQATSSDEFEREPVPARSLLGFKSFVGMYAGEHCAGTELMIGPLFIAAGVSAFDLIAGLLLGNLLAVLSWMFLTAPIATRSRLTLVLSAREDLRPQAGHALQPGQRRDVLLPGRGDDHGLRYGVGRHVRLQHAPIDRHRAQQLGMGAGRLGGWRVNLDRGRARVPERVALRQHRRTLDGPRLPGVRTGRRPAVPGRHRGTGPISRRRVGIGHHQHLERRGRVAWPDEIHLLAHHVLRLVLQHGHAHRHVRFVGVPLRQKSHYAVATGAGMYVGHFMAWIAASMLFAFELHETHPSPYMVDLLRTHSAHYADVDPAELLASPMTSELLRDAMEIERQLVAAGQLAESDKQISVPTPLPGPLAYQACGIAGLLCVIFAGWTTANPTIYRAGLAFQAIVPRTSRFVVTLLTGALATLAGLFPAIAMKLLDFVAIYGMILMPMGAVIFVDFWLVRKFGLRSNYAEVSRTRFNWAAGLTWFLTLAACVSLNRFLGIEIFFVSLPGWFVAAILYVVLSRFYQNSIHQEVAAEATH